MNILFLGRDKKEDVWEYDYITKEILPKKTALIITFANLKQVQNSDEEYDVLIYSARDPNNYPWGWMPTYNEVLSCVLKTKPKIIIQLSDEFLFEDLQEHNQLGNYCELFLRQHHFLNYSYTTNTIQLPLGYGNGCAVYNEKKLYNWSFLGEIKTNRQEMIDVFCEIPNHYVGNNHTTDEMCKIYSQSIFVLCGRGNLSLNCYRQYEASMNGAIPVVVGPKEEVEWTFKYEENPPWIFAESWEEAKNICVDLLNDTNKLYELKNQTLNWWSNRITNVKKMVEDIFKEEKNISHIYDQPQFGENWFSYSDFYHDIVKKFESGSVFVEVGSWKGKSSAFMATEIANSKKDITFYCVDTWEGSVEHQLGNYWHTEDLHILYDIFIKNMKPLEKYYFPLKVSSLSAALKFKDNSIDFVYIDASHEYKDVVDDIKAWMPKVKPGGIIAGHDYGSPYFGVTQAVDELIPNASNDLSQGIWFYQIPLKKGIDSNKLKNFPSVNFISTEESWDRREKLYKLFEKYNLKKITPHIFKKYNDAEHFISGNNVDHLAPSSTRGPVTSHIKAIKEWYLNTDEEYTIFFEDDVSFELVKHWNFTWQEFFDNLPPSWECVQLSLMCDGFSGSDQYLINEFERGKLSLRDWCDWSCCAYLIKRSHAKRIVESYYPNHSIILEYKGHDTERRSDVWTIRPTPETLVFSYFIDTNISDTIFKFPLFLESNQFKSTWTDEKHDDEQSPHNISRKIAISWWETKGRTLDIKQIMDYNS